ncbi:MAG: CotH kinase family protein, partial [Pontiellaceae bacterium]|nr:CotH kinase family protein [Pontiellaceae bacterium]
MALALFLPARGSAAVMINEFMASNAGTLTDSQGDFDDWIEIYNSGPGTADLSGMYLTDDLLNSTKWQIPAGTLVEQGNYLLIWADEDVLDSGLHANFKLSAGGEEIGLYSADGMTLLDSIAFGDQTEDISYGRFPNGGSSWLFMNSPTPNAANISAQSETVYFSRLSGVMTNSFTLKLSTQSDTGQIRYTTDGSEPSALSLLYSDESGILIHNSNSVKIRARAFQNGLAPGPVRTEAYLAVSAALQHFDSNLPIVIIDTFGQQLPASWWDENLQTVLHPDMIASFAAFIQTNTITGRAAVMDEPDYTGRAGIRERGQSSQEAPKKPYKLETWDEYDQDQKASLFGLPADSDWVLNNVYTDKSFMRNVLIYKWSNDMGHYASRTKFVEVFFNEDGGQIGGPDSADYRGIY